MILKTSFEQKKRLSYHSVNKVSEDTDDVNQQPGSNVIKLSFS
jgi:hypothetical protein